MTQLQKLVVDVIAAVTFVVADDNVVVREQSRVLASVRTLRSRRRDRPDKAEKTGYH